MSAVFIGRIAKQQHDLSPILKEFLPLSVRPTAARLSARTALRLDNHSAFCVGSIKAPLSESQINVIG